MRKLAFLAVFAATAVTLAAVAAAGPVSTKQRITIDVKEESGSFVLTPATSGAIRADGGTAIFCCWSSRRIVRDGQAIELNNPEMTLTGKQGTLVARNQIAWVDVRDGLAVFTGTWKVIRGTGVYAALSGGGRAVGVTFANGTGKSRFAGVLSSK